MQIPICYNETTKQFTIDGSIQSACAAALQHTYVTWHATPTRTTDQLPHCANDLVYNNYIETMKPSWIQHMASDIKLRVLHAEPDGNRLFHSVSLVLTGT